MFPKTVSKLPVRDGESPLFADTSELAGLHLAMNDHRKDQVHKPNL